MAAVITLSGSSMESSSVATLNVAVAELAAKSTVVGAVPEIVDPVSLTATVTVSIAAGSPLRVRVNSAAVPSPTEAASAAIVTVGTPTGGSSSSVTFTVAEEGVPTV